MCLRAYGYQPQERCLAAARLENFHHQTASYVCKGDTHKIPSLVISSSLTPPKKADRDQGPTTADDLFK